MSEIPDPEDIQENTRLSPQESRVFVKKYHKGKNIPKIAVELDVGEGTISKALDRIRKKREESENTAQIFEEVEDDE